MRALVVVTHPFPALMGIWRAATRSGLDIHIAATMDPKSRESFPLAPEVPDFGTTHLLRALTMPGRDQLWWVYPGLRRLVRRLRPDVIHVNSEAWGLRVTQVAGMGPPLVIHGADNLFTHGSRAEARIRLALARRNLSRAAAYVSWNVAGKELAKDHGLARNAPTLVAPAVVRELSEFDHLPRPRRDDNSFVVCFVGNLVAQKGPDVLIRAAAGIDRALVRIVGDGPMRSEVERLAAELRVRVDFVGRLPAEDVPKILAASDVAVMPSRTCPDLVEQFGRVAVEAMLSRVPVVVSDCGALPEVTGGTQLVFAEDDPAALAAHLQRLAADPGLRDRLGADGRRWAESQYAPSAIAARIVLLWRRAAPLQVAA